VILEALACALLAAGPDGGVPQEDLSLERYRAPLEVLVERPIGETSRAVRFDWRRARISFGAITSTLLELNNFSSLRVGGYVRKALGSFMLELAVTYVFTWGSDASEKLSLTPYRQFGRPNRVEVDVNLSYPLAEGVVTARPGFLPPAELVFSATAGIRYLFYPGALANVPAVDVVGSLFAPRITQAEVDNLDARRVPSMQVDRARYGLLAGFTLDLWLRPGVNVSPRVLIALPVFSNLEGAGLGWWWELSLALGVAL